MIGIVGIAYNCQIENAIGGSSEDFITGNALDNTLYGGVGANVFDSLTGGAGSDIFKINASTDASAATNNNSPSGSTPAKAISIAHSKDSLMVKFVGYTDEINTAINGGTIKLQTNDGSATALSAEALTFQQKSPGSYEITQTQIDTAISAVTGLESIAIKDTSSRYFKF